MYLTMLKNSVTGMGTILRTLVMVASHATRKRDTILYPEQPVPVPPRFRGRIVLTRDPDGDERCVACNLCAVACPVGCISLQKRNVKTVVGMPNFSVSIFHAVFLWNVRRSLSDNSNSDDPRF